MLECLEGSADPTTILISVVVMIMFVSQDSLLGVCFSHNAPGVQPPSFKKLVSLFKYIHFWRDLEGPLHASLPDEGLDDRNVALACIILCK